MAILQATTSQIGQSGQIPKIIYLQTNNTVAQVTTAGYLNNLIENFGIALAETDIALVSTKTSPSAVASSVAFYDVSYSGGNWTLVAISSGGGGVNPGLANELAYYAGAGSTVSGLTTANNGVLVTSAGGVPSIGSTLPNAVQDNITRLGTIASIGAPLGAAFGGTGVVNNAANTLTWSGAFPATFTLTGVTGVTFPTSGTLATTGMIPSLPLSMANGGTNKALVAANGGLVYSDSDSLEILAPTATANQIPLSGSSSAPSWSTLTYLNTAGANTIPYASSANVLGTIAAAAGGVLISSAASVPSMLANPAADYRMLFSRNAAAAEWSAYAMPSVVSGAGTLLRSDGTNYAGTTLTMPATIGINEIFYASSANVLAPVAAAVGGVMISNNLGVPSMLANPTATGRVLTSVNGAAAVWSTGAFPTSAGAAGTFLRSNGTDWVASTPTLANTYAVNTLLYAASADAVSGLATANGAVLATNASGVPSMVALTDGQIIIGDTGGAALAANITGGTGISVVNGANSITINQTGGGMSWNIGLTPGTVTVNNAYVDTIGGQTYVLPANANVGDMVRVVGSAAGNWVLQAGAGDIIHLGTATTSGGGTLTATDDHDSVEVVCIVANSEWTVLSVVSAGLTVA